MKKIFGVAPLALALLVVGCENMLEEEPESFVTTNTFYKTPADIESAVLSAYHPLMDRELLSRQTIWFLDLASDQARVNPDEPNFATSHPDYLGWDASSQFARNQWRQLYRINQRATLAIENAANIQMDEGRRAQLIGEAKFLRALAYWYLVRIYGDVPLLVTEKEILQQSVARTPSEQVIAQVLKDAQDAEAALPVAWSGNMRGRATRGAAQALQTDVHIWTKNWQSAAATAKKIIDSGTYSLFDDYLDAFLPATKNGREHIFSVQATGIDSRTSSAYPNSYFPRVLGFNQGGGWGVVQPTEWFYNSYPEGDYRKQVSFRTEGCSINPSIGCKSDFYPMPWKFRPTNGGIPQDRGDVDIPVYRYAEVLLWYAEALNELGRSAEAVEYLNRIRARARKGTGSQNLASPEDYTGPMGKDAVREAIFMERNWELAFEQKRWFDLVRRGWDYVVTNLRAHDPNARTGGYLDAYRLVLPLPQSQLDLDPALKQNPGY